MGLFDNILGKSASESAASFMPKNENQAILALLISISNADGDGSESELDYWTSALVKKKWFYSGELNEYVKPVYNALQAYGVQSLINGSAPIISEKRKQTVFALCCECAFADGVVNEKEKENLESIASLLNLDKDTASKIIEVLLIKNMDNIIINS